VTRVGVAVGIIIVIEAAWSEIVGGRRRSVVAQHVGDHHGDLAGRGHMEELVRAVSASWLVQAARGREV
jgi:hypothetical protein